jgi:hypothetical protein
MDGFNAEAGINQRIAEASESGSGRRQCAPGRQPDEREAGRLDDYADQRDPGAAELIG